MSVKDTAKAAWPQLVSYPRIGKLLCDDSLGVADLAASYHAMASRKESTTIPGNLSEWFSLQLYYITPYGY